MQHLDGARFERHPEIEASYGVLLGLLGREQQVARDPNARLERSSASRRSCFGSVGCPRTIALVMTRTHPATGRADSIDQ